MTEDHPSSAYLFESGSRRERRALARWARVFLPELLGTLGVRGIWWCGLCLPRIGVFGSTAGPGDVDLIAGDLEFALPVDEIRRRIERESALCPDAHPTWWEEAAIAKAAQEGHLVWPPECRYVVACEAKSSWYDRDAEGPSKPREGTIETHYKWKASHRRKGGRVAGQLRALLRPGVVRIGFLHLVSTRPQPSWTSGGEEALDLVNSFPLLDGPEAIPGCGYFQVAIQAVEGGTEDLRGRGGLPYVVRPARDQFNPMTAGSGQLEWLRSSLNACKKPLTARTFVVACSRCGSWWTTSDVVEACCPRCARRWSDMESV
jgi:hypothetical protein